jgi:Flp pilus assembly protein TadG
MRALRRRPRRGDDGAAAVEFALVGGFLLVPLLLGVIVYGYYFLSTTTVNSALRDGARTAAVGSTCADWEAVMRQRLRGVNWSTASMTARTTRLQEFTVTVAWNGPSFGAPFPTPDAVSSLSTATRVERVPAATGACSVTR